MALAALHREQPKAWAILSSFVARRRCQISLPVVRSFSPPQHTGWSAGPSPWGCCSLVLSYK